MRTIYKYPIPLDSLDSFSLDMARGARILDVQNQGPFPMLWAEIHTEDPTEKRYFRVYGTGHELPIEPLLYIATFQSLTSMGWLVWHIYEVFQ